MYRRLGRTGLDVSAIALGTVSLGVDYGIAAPGEFGRPEEADAVRLLRDAVDAGINLFDTAPAYGASERLLGQVVGSNTRCYVATKVPVFERADGLLLRGAELRQALWRCLDDSRRALARDVLDIVQIHNATVEVITQGEIADALLDARAKGRLRFLGASVYGEDAALSAIEAKCFDVLQVAYSLLDQRMTRRVFPAAQRAGVGILVRSALLKGALTPKAQWLPQALTPVREAAERARDLFGGSWEALPVMAVRFCLSEPAVASVLVGSRTKAELAEALAAREAGSLPADLLARASTLGLDDDRLVNPSYWPVA